MSKKTTFSLKGQPYCTVDILPLPQETLEQASVALRKEHGRKFVPGEMDLDELAEYGAECARRAVENLEMADGTRPLLGKDPKSARKWFREPGRHSLVNGINRIATQMAEEENEEIEVTSGN